MKKDPLSEGSRKAGDNVGTLAESAILPRVPIVVMGPAGSGKTTLGQRLARALGRRFVDADDHHPPANIEKMRNGIGLTDEDRKPWLLGLRQMLAESPNTVLACSALKKSYRTLLRPEAVDVVFLLLDVPEAELARRLKARTDHYAGPTLLASQLAILESPSGEPGLFVLDGSQTKELVFEQAKKALGLKPGENAR